MSRVKLMKKSGSWLMRTIARLPFIPDSFMSGYWTTIGDIVYAPTRYDGDTDWGQPEWVTRNARIIEHEQIHVDQWNRYGGFVFATIYLGPSVTVAFPCALLGLLLVPWTSLFLLVALATFALLLPLSIGLAFGRFAMEMEAYRPELQALLRTREQPLWHFDQRVLRLVAQLWEDYAWTLPPSLARKLVYNEMGVVPPWKR